MADGAVAGGPVAGGPVAGGLGRRGGRKHPKASKSTGKFQRVIGELKHREKLDQKTMTEAKMTL